MHALIDPIAMDAMEERTFLPRRSKVRTEEDQRQEAFDRIDQMDLEEIKEMLMLPVEERGEGWTQRRANLIERRYKAFWKLCVMFPKMNHVPTSDIDHMWHWHILFTQRYRQDCQDTFGHYLDHNPREQTDEAKEELLKGYERTKRLFKEVFGMKLPDKHTGDCSPFPGC